VVAPRPTKQESPEDFAARWLTACVELTREVRTAARQALIGAVERVPTAPGDRSRALWLAPLGEGVADTTYPLDHAAETVLGGWFEARARQGALSVFSEDTGWRHLGPKRGGGVRELESFDHGGPRIAVDPVDGTRNLMGDLRSAWTAIAIAPPGAGEPRLADVQTGLLAEIPDSRGARSRVLHGTRGQGAYVEICDLMGRALEPAQRLHVDGDDRVDHGYFPFFRYAPDLRPAIAALEADFFARLERLEGADVRNCWDDQYIASAGQLALLALGTYRMVVDLRPVVAARLGRTTQPSKPYDVAGAIVVAKEAGCVVLHPEGAELDFALDAVTPVAFAGFHGQATARRLLPHLLDTLGVPASGRPLP